MKFIDGIDRLNTLVGRIAAWSVLLMALIGALNALASYLEPLAGRRLASVALDELQWYLFSVLFLLAANIFVFVSITNHEAARFLVRKRTESLFKHAWIGLSVVAGF